MYINSPSQYDIVSMAKRFHIGFYAKYKNEMSRCCIFSTVFGTVTNLHILINLV